LEYDMADEGPDETKLAEQINRHKPRPEGAAPNEPHGSRDQGGHNRGEQRSGHDDTARRPLRDRRVHPESGGREPERDE
jgi:hypothetical protein